MTRACAWPGFVNARSLGGIRIGADTIAPGALFRSDEPEASASSVTQSLAAAGIRTVVDLRSKAETRRRPAVHAHLPAYVVALLVDPRTDHLHRTHGGGARYLHSHGLTDVELERLRRRFASA